MIRILLGRSHCSQCVPDSHEGCSQARASRVPPVTPTAPRPPPARTGPSKYSPEGPTWTRVYLVALPALTAHCTTCLDWLAAREGLISATRASRALRQMPMEGLRVASHCTVTNRRLHSEWRVAHKVASVCLPPSVCLLHLSTFLYQPARETIATTTEPVSALPLLECHRCHSPLSSMHSYPHRSNYRSSRQTMPATTVGRKYGSTPQPCVCHLNAFLSPTTYSVLLQVADLRFSSSDNQPAMTARSHCPEGSPATDASPLVRPAQSPSSARAPTRPSHGHLHTGVLLLTLTLLNLCSPTQQLDFSIEKLLEYNSLVSVICQCDRGCHSDTHSLHRPVASARSTRISRNATRGARRRPSRTWRMWS